MKLVKLSNCTNIIDTLSLCTMRNYQLICITPLYPVNDNYSINLYVALCIVSFVQSLPKITMFCGILIVNLHLVMQGYLAAK